MSLLNFISEKFMLPLSDIATGYSIAKNLASLNKSQYWTREQIDAYQNAKLTKLIRHAYDNVPFYHDLFNGLKIKPEDIKSKEDLRKLPVITKDDLKRNKDKFLAANLKKKGLIYSSSSGSTGEPFQYYATVESDSVLKAAAIRAWYWMGYRLGDKYIKVSMNPRNSRIKKIQDFLNNSVYLSANQLIPSEFDRLAERIHQEDPEFIRCYSVPLLYLSHQLKEAYGGYTGKALKAINTTGSTLHEDVRQKIEAIFKVKIYDAYSCEGGAVFAQCPHHRFYHPSEEYAISEFLADSVTAADPEKPYRHITTDLHNYASPFIRYDTQDYLVLGDDAPCSCGREFLNIKSIRGRDGDILRTPSGKILIVENFVAYFEWINEVDTIQVEQTKVDEIIIRVVANDAFNESVMKKLLDYWQNYIGSDVTVKIEVVKEIVLTKAGKRRTVIRNPEIKLNV
jgi:phenylacetate-CoA ligase